MDNTQKKRKLLVSGIAGLLLISGSTITVRSAEVIGENTLPFPAAGIETVLEQGVEDDAKKSLESYLVRTENQGYIKKKATVTADVLNVREGQGTESRILTQILEGQSYQITGDSVDGWYPVEIGEIDGWVCGEYITIEMFFSYEESREEEQPLENEAEQKESGQAEVLQAASYTPMQDYTGQAVIDFACQFIGNPYVWGGTSLTNGADCSGFVQSVYANFGISLPRTTWEMESAGYGVSYEEAAPGDLILYDGHVGLYMGDGTIVNAMNEEDGIGICSATYAPIVAVRRVL